MNKPEHFLLIAVGTLLVGISPIAFAQDGDPQGQGRAVLTLLPSKDAAQPADVTLTELSIKVDGKAANVTALRPLRGADSRLELVLLIDGSARSTLGGQMDEISRFLQEIPSNTKAAIAYMQNGQAVMTGPLSADPAAVVRGLHIPSGSAGSNGSPYFCLTDLAKNWPSTDGEARREVVMITDGVDNFQRGFNPDDPYVQDAISNSIRAGLVVYAMYWSNQGRALNPQAESDIGQNLLMQVTDATGGKSYYEGTGNPVSFQPYFDDLRRRLRSQYSLSFASRMGNKPEVLSLRLKATVPSAKVAAPQLVYVSRAGQ